MTREFVVQTVEATGSPYWISGLISQSPWVEVEPIGAPVIRGEGQGYVVRHYYYKIYLRELPVFGRHDVNLRLTKTSGFDEMLLMTLHVEPSVHLVPSTIILNSEIRESLVDVIARDSDVSFSVRVADAPAWVEVRRETEQSQGVERFAIRINDEVAQGQTCSGVVQFCVDGTANTCLKLFVCARPGI